MGGGKIRECSDWSFQISHLSPCRARPRTKFGDGHHHQSVRNPSRKHSHGRNLVKGRNHVNRTLKQRMQKCGCVFSPMNLIVEDTSGVHNSIYAVRYCHHEDKCYCCTKRASNHAGDYHGVLYTPCARRLYSEATSIVCRMRAHPWQESPQMAAVGSIHRRARPSCGHYAYIMHVNTNHKILRFAILSSICLACLVWRPRSL
jgi:hypothetical protein